jgi:surface antigen
MKNTLYAAIAACIAMLGTSGIVALATAGAPRTTPDAERELVEQIDGAIARQLADVKARLAID